MKWYSDRGAERRPHWWALPVVLLLLAGEPASAAAPRHFVFFNRDRERIKEAWFADTPTFAGAQVKYTWKELEPERDKYEFGPLLEDLAFLSARNKRLFVQLQETSFETNRVLVPDYLRTPEFGGGVAMQYAFADESEEQATPEGWVARRWDPRVQKRFHMLLEELGQAVDGHIEGLNLPETAVGFGERTNRHPEGFTFIGYREAVQTNMLAAKAAFPRSIVMQYANFMPGEWLPWKDGGHLKGVYEFALQHGIGVGGPDLLPFRKGQLNHSYPLIKAASGKVPTGIAVQIGNYAAVNPATGQPPDIGQLIQFAAVELGVDFIFWSTQEPHFSREVVPHLESLRQKAVDRR
ncbi:MAG TPA: hypothetical protein DCY13_04210 [Verrucomicrobiales bacterium]|nr:hypothetical protein [Verrucomicrobiales bacterium]